MLTQRTTDHSGRTHLGAHMHARQLAASGPPSAAPPAASAAGQAAAGHHKAPTSRTHTNKQPLCPYSVNSVYSRLSHDRSPLLHTTIRSLDWALGPQHSTARHLQPYRCFPDTCRSTLPALPDHTRAAHRPSVGGEPDPEPAPCHVAASAAGYNSRPGLLASRRTQQAQRGLAY
jgi:hypothetical protein